MSLILPWNEKADEKTRENFFNTTVNNKLSLNAKEAGEIEQQLVMANQELKQIGNPPRWLLRRHQDMQKKVKLLKESLADLKKDKSQVRRDVENIERKYAETLRNIRGNPKHLLTQSVHSVAPGKKVRSSVVVISRENSAELLRQKFRAELGLQELPLMISAGDICDECGLSMLIVSSDSMLSCPQCHKMRVLPNTMSSSTMHGADADPASIITKHRFPEWLEFIQAKDVCSPPEEVLEAVGAYLIEHKMTGLEDYAEEIAHERRANGPFKNVDDAQARLPNIPTLKEACKDLMSRNPFLIRMVLKNLVTRGEDKFRKFYERSVKIGALLSGFWPPRLSGNQEEMLRMLFCAAAPFYEKERKPKTTTWPGGFPYFLRSLCILLGWDEFAQQFPVSESNINISRDILRHKIWSNPELNWECVPYTGKLPPIRLPSGELRHTILDDTLAGAREDDEGGEEFTIKKCTKPPKEKKRKRHENFEFL
jgi:hypothetical protein